MMLEGILSGSAGESVAWQLTIPDSNEPCPVVFLHHGFKGFADWNFFPWLAGELAKSGIAALKYNTAHNGVGTGADASSFTRLDLFARNRQSYEIEDLSCLVKALQEGSLSEDATQHVDPERIGFFGHSRGGAAVLLTARDLHPLCKAVTTWASVSTTALPPEAGQAIEAEGFWSVLNSRTGQEMRLNRTAWDDVTPMPERLNLELALPNFAEELLIVHGMADETVPPAAAKLLQSWSQDKAQLHLVPGAGHTFNSKHPFEGPSPELIEAAKVTIAHFKRWL